MATSAAEKRDQGIVMEEQRSLVAHYGVGAKPSCSASSHQHKQHKNVQLDDWRHRLSLFTLHVLKYIADPLKSFGNWLEWLCNFVHINGGVLKTVYKLAFRSSDLLPTPEPDSDAYWSLIGLMDTRRALFNQRQDLDYFPKACPDHRSVADVCAMASKLAYENSAVVKSVVEGAWKMHLVGFYDFWNEHLSIKSTQAYIFMDQQQDAEAIVVAFRGTEAFNSYDWCTDFDFSWYELPDLGRVHIGFLEALGLANRNDMSSFEKLTGNMSQSNATMATPASGLSDQVIGDDEKLLAYDYITQKLLSLLSTNTNAKLYITGHSLGGALAALFTAMLFSQCSKNEEKLPERLAAMYTFGQPRVGDEKFAAFVNKQLNEPVKRGFRIVYNSDLVPRVPFDNSLFGFKHFGECHYYNFLYKLHILQDEPNPNFFAPLAMILAHLVATLEFLLSFIVVHRHGESFKETLLSSLFRLMGLFLPGFAGHSLVNYINSARLGPEHSDPCCPARKRTDENGVRKKKT